MTTSCLRGSRTRSRTRSTTLLLVSALAPAMGTSLPACASGGRAAAANATTPVARPSRDLTRTQMVDAGYTSLYAAIEALRHHWLLTHGVDSFANPGQVVVYVDEMRAGGVDVLRAIPPAAVAYVRRYSAVESQSRWGVGHTQGVIFVALLSDEEVAGTRTGRAARMPRAGADSNRSTPFSEQGAP